MLEVKNVSKRFGTINALNNVSFSLPRGKVLGIVGDNNAGRTTLSILCGALQPDSGEFYLDGQRHSIKTLPMLMGAVWPWCTSSLNL